MPDKSSANQTNANRAPTGREARQWFKPLTQDQVAAYADPESVSRGQDYLATNRIIDAVLRGATLHGESLGQSGGPYRIRVTFVPADAPGADPLAGWSCTCPRGGFCKHVVALLLLWIRRPQEVEVRADIAALLRERSREELLALLLGVLQRDPDLDRWIEAKLLPLTQPAAPGAGAQVTVDLKKIGRQAAAAFAHGGYEWGANGDVAGELDTLLDTARGYAAAAAWANAATVFTAVAEEAIAHYEEVDDETGEVMEVVQRCELGLRGCLAAQVELAPADRLAPHGRQDLLRTLYAIWKHALEYAGDPADLDEDLPTFLAHTVTPGEREAIEGWLRAELARYAGSRNDYYAGNRRDLVQFLLALRGPEGRNGDVALEEYRAAGLYGDVVAQLIDRGRIDDAFQVAAKELVGSREVLEFAGKLLRQDAPPRDRVLAFVEDRLARETNAPAEDAYRQWLAERYIEFEMPDMAFTMAQARFHAAPHLDTYSLVKRAALLPGQPADRWTAARPTLIRALEQKNLWGALITIYLQEEQIPEALAALDTLERPVPLTSIYGGYYQGQPQAQLATQVARAAEAAYPARARAIYERLVDRLIAAQGRERYQAAATHLLRVRDLYLRDDQAAAWATYIADLRAHHKRLRALKEELDHRGLR